MCNVYMELDPILESSSKTILIWKNVLELESKDLKLQGLKFKPPLGEPPNKLCNVQTGIGGCFL